MKHPDWEAIYDSELERMQMEYLEKKTMPDDSEVRTWHVHDDGTWQWGAVCDKCAAPPRPDYEGPMFNIRRLRSDNLGGYTQRELAREITDAADREGREIDHPR